MTDYGEERSTPALRMSKQSQAAELLRIMLAEGPIKASEVQALFKRENITHGSTLNGCIGLVIAFLLSPYGLPLLAVKLLAWFIAMRMLLRERIYG